MNPPISISLPKELIDRIDSIAGETKSSRSYIIKEALNAYIEEDTDLQIALIRFQDETEPLLSCKDFKKEIQLLSLLTNWIKVITM